MYIKFVHSELQSLGIEYLSAILKREGHKTKLIVDPSFITFKNFELFFKKITNYKNKLLNKILSDKPDLIAFSVNSYNMKWVCSLVLEIKKHSNIPIVLGGIQATLMPEHIFKKSNADLIILGEGEMPLLELASSLEKWKLNPRIRNLCINNNGKITMNPLRDLISNLDTLPYPDKELLPDWFNRSLYRVITARGCIGNCSYCCVPIQKRMYNGKGQFLRHRSIENVLGELKIAKGKYNIKRILFEDDLFTYDREWLRDFAEKYKRDISLPCFIHTTPNAVDEEIVGLLKKISCYAVEIGVQSLNSKIRRNVFYRYETNKQIKNAILLLKENQINCICDNITSIPGLGIKDTINMVRFYNLVRPGKIEALRLQFYPKAPITYKFSHSTQIINKINEHGFFVSGNGNTTQSDKIMLILGLIYIFSPRIISFILRKKIYRFFPHIENFNYLNELLFYFSSIFKRNRLKACISLRADLFLKLRYLFCHIQQ